MRNPSISTDRSHTYSGADRITSSLKKLFALAVGAAAFGSFASAQTAGTFQVTNLLSDGSVPALSTDANFINPWGVSIGKDFWINTQATGFDYVAVVPGATPAITVPQIPFKVVIPSAGSVKTVTGTPSGTVFYAGTGFVLPNGAPPSFLFSTLDGTVSGWNIGLGTAGSVAQIAIDNSATNAVYTDMALMTNATGTFLLTANFGAGADVEVYDSSYKVAKLAGSFADPNVPAGYAPYGIHSIGSQVFVTYMLRTAVASTTPAPVSGPAPYLASPKASGGIAYQQTLGAGNGFVDVFDNNGNFVARAIDTGGNLNAPWGVAIAPLTFGVFGGDLLVGNFGDGHINAYDPTTFAFRGQLTDGTGKAIAYPGMWELVFGTSTGATGYGDPSTLFFSAGINNEKGGLFASIVNSPTSTAPATFGVSTSTAAASVKAGAAATMVVAVAPTNSFSGSVTLSCTGLPAGATCSFSPAQLSVSSTQSATSTVTIQTAVAAASTTQTQGITARHAAEIAAAMLLPFGSLLAFVRRRPVRGTSTLRLLGIVAILLMVSGAIVGCSGASTAGTTPTPVVPTPTPTPTPAPSAVTSQVVITATAGTTVQTSTIALTVQ